MQTSFDDSNMVPFDPYHASKEESSDPFKVCPDLASDVGKAAFRHSQTFDSQSMLVKGDRDQAFQPCQVNWNDMKIGDLIGYGAFSKVQEVKMVGNCSCYPECSSGSRGCVRGTHYAVKLLKTSVKRRKDTFEAAAIDLVNESKLLTHLDHKNIIRLHGISDGCLSEAYLDKNGYFLVLERLDDTLEDMLKRLRIEDRQLKDTSFIKRLSCIHRRGPFLTDIQKSQRAARLQDIALPVASAMQYLHEKQIIYRDLKPSNIGFDANGTPKLFDFGLAREIVENCRRMTPSCGSLRYMSPENARSSNYSFPADVYSFGVLLWEVMTLEKPFMEITPSVFHDLVVKSAFRPRVDGRVGSKSLQSLIRRCWDPSPELRPTFVEVMEILQSEVLIGKSNSKK